MLHKDIFACGSWHVIHLQVGVLSVGCEQVLDEGGLSCTVANRLCRVRATDAQEDTVANRLCRARATDAQEDMLLYVLHSCKAARHQSNQAVAGRCKRTMNASASLTNKKMSAAKTLQGCNHITMNTEFHYIVRCAVIQDVCLLAKLKQHCHFHNESSETAIVQLSLPLVAHYA